MIKSKYYPWNNEWEFKTHDYLHKQPYHASYNASKIYYLLHFGRGRLYKFHLTSYKRAKYLYENYVRINVQI